MNDTGSATHPTAGSQSGSSVEAPLTFIRRSDAKPVLQSAALTGSAPRELFETERHAVPIRDVRPSAQMLSLDREGFLLLRHPSAVTDYYDDDQIERVYHPEIAAFLRRVTGADRVVVFDTTRRSDGGAGASNRDGLRRPASRVHVDYTERSGPQRVMDLLGETEAERLFTADVRIIQINVWRPIRGPVERSPLALADASTVRFEDLIATDQVFPDRVGEIYHLAYHPSQRWYYAPRMTSDEILLIKGWDSLDDGRTRFTPHGAFELPDTPEHAPARESIEVRTLVIKGS
jgi:hypothetical protein